MTGCAGPMEACHPSVYFDNQSTKIKALGRTGDAYELRGSDTNVARGSTNMTTSRIQNPTMHLVPSLAMSSQAHANDPYMTNNSVYAARGLVCKSTTHAYRSCAIIVPTNLRTRHCLHTGDAPKRTTRRAYTRASKFGRNLTIPTSRKQSMYV